jgi:hypothetical protein
MSRQHATPVLLPANGDSAVPLTRLRLEAGGDNVILEADLQAIIHAHPECLPLGEIDPAFAGAIAVCRELVTPAGRIDNFLVTAAGFPVLVECKLWRNPESRREVVGQILDYAKELRRWSSADLQREVRRSLGQGGDPVLDLVRKHDPDVDAGQFNDALTANLRRGRCLLLIVGDGIREGVETIAEYLQEHAGLHFSFGLVELPFYRMPDGGRLVAPRVLAHTEVITRTVVAVPDGYLVTGGDEVAEMPGDDPEKQALSDERQRFWREFLTYVRLDDPEQSVPTPARMGYLNFMMPAPAGSCWLTVYRNMQKGNVGVTLSAHRNTAGDYAMRTIAEDWDSVACELGVDAKMGTDQYGRPQITASETFGPLDQPEVRRRAFVWLAERVNLFVNALRPKVRSLALEYASRQVQAG